MPSKELDAKLLSLWPKLKQSYRLVSQKGRTDGILFLCKGRQAEEAMEAVAEALALPRIDFSIGRVGRKDFKEKTELLFQTSHQMDLFGINADAYCLTISRLDEYGEWLAMHVKAIFEGRKVPCVILATASDEKSLPTYLGGHFHVCRKKGAPVRAPGAA